MEREVTRNARLILTHARSTVDAFDDAFATVREKRGVSAGAPKDADQDLLRAALVLAAAGLDSLTKHLIRDSLPQLLTRDPVVQEGLEEFALRRLRPDPDSGEGASGNRFLARTLSAQSSRDHLIEEYVRDLTGASMQSAEEVMKASNALGLDAQALGIDPKKLKPIFATRNKIIHELDIDLTRQTRKRQKRTREQMLADARALMQVGEKLIEGVEAKLGLPR